MDVGMTEVGSGPGERKMPVQEKKAAPVFTKKENATIAQRIEILNWYHEHSSPKKSQVKTAAHFNKIYPNLRLKQPIISDWIQNEVKWRKEWAEQQSVRSDTRRATTTTDRANLLKSAEADTQS